MACVWLECVMHEMQVAWGGAGGDELTSRSAGMISALLSCDGPAWAVLGGKHTAWHCEMCCAELSVDINIVFTCLCYVPPTPLAPALSR